MSRLILPLCLAFIVSAAVIGESQRHKVIPQPPAPADSQITTNQQNPKITTNQPTPQKRHFDAVQAEREARELSDLAKTVPLDVEHVNQGLMPKDMLEKLKRIEKLSKHLRTELASQ